MCPSVVSAGTVGVLDQPIMAFVRLQEAVVLQSILEVSVPVRFLLVLIGPLTCNTDYQQIGHCVSLLMSDEVSRVHAACHSVIFKREHQRAQSIATIVK